MGPEDRLYGAGDGPGYKGLQRLHRSWGFGLVLEGYAMVRGWAGVGRQESDPDCLRAPEVGNGPRRSWR